MIMCTSIYLFIFIINGKKGGEGSKNVWVMYKGANRFTCIFYFILSLLVKVVILSLAFDVIQINFYLVVVVGVSDKNTCKYTNINIQRYILL